MAFNLLENVEFSRDDMSVITDQEIASLIAKGVIEVLPDGKMRATPAAQSKFTAMFPLLMLARKIARDSGITDIRKMAEILVALKNGSLEQIKLIECNCPRCVAERAGLGRGSVVDGTGSVN